MTSHPEFGYETTATEVAAAFGDSIRGRNIVVTGVSPSSIGYTTVKAIVSQSPAILILASRTQQKMDTVQAELAKINPAVDVRTVRLDLGDVESVKTAAAEVQGLVPHIDVLINNAGVNAPERCPLTTPDGSVVDTHFYTNHLGVFLFTSLLLPQLRAAAAALGDDKVKNTTRVVNVSSQGHHLSPVRFSDYGFFKGMYDVPESELPTKDAPPFFLQLTNGYPCFPGYGQSKTANILHATELSRRLHKAGDHVLAFSLHPGTIVTGLPRSLGEEGYEALMKTARNGVCKTLDQGASTTLVAAFDPKLGEVDVGGASVGYLNDCQLQDQIVAPYASDPAIATRLWEESERLLQFKVAV